MLTAASVVPVVAPRLVRGGQGILREHIQEHKTWLWAARDSENSAHVETHIWHDKFCCGWYFRLSFNYELLHVITKNVILQDM